MRNNGLPNVRERTVSQLVAGASLREPSRFSKLENGLKVVTCDNGGDVAEVRNFLELAIHHSFNGFKLANLGPS